MTNPERPPQWKRIYLAVALQAVAVIFLLGLFSRVFR